MWLFVEWLLKKDWRFWLSTVKASLNVRQWMWSLKRYSQIFDYFFSCVFLWCCTTVRFDFSPYLPGNQRSTGLGLRETPGSIRILSKRLTLSSPLLIDSFGIKSRALEKRIRFSALPWCNNGSNMHLLRLKNHYSLDLSAHHRILPLQRQTHHYWASNGLWVCF